MRRCAARTNRWAPTYPCSTEIPPGNCRWRGPFWSTSRASFVWLLSILTSRAALTRQSSSRGSTNSRAIGKGPPHDPLPPKECLSVEYVPGGAVFLLAYDNDLSIGAVCSHQTMGIRNVFKWEDRHSLHFGNGDGGLSKRGCSAAHKQHLVGSDLTPHFHPGELCGSLCSDIYYYGQMRITIDVL